jgi:hypothetical protein
MVQFRLRIPCLPAAALGVSGVLLAASAGAQIKEPGAHPSYGVELEPHFLVQWADQYWGSDGVGLGLRASIPVIDNGPVTKINNNFAIGFGLDWAHYSDCAWWWGGPRPINFATYDCSGNTFTFPVVAQWNFYFTPVVSAFVEGGLAIEYWTMDNPPCAGCKHSDVTVDGVFAVGPRFRLADSFAITLRIGWPYLSAGASFFL